MASAIQPVSAEARQIQLTLAGNLEAFCELVKPHQRILYLEALSIVRSEADAEDVVQNAVFKAFRNLSHFRQESQFRTWMMSITINEARMWLRRNGKPRLESLDREDEDGDQVSLEIADQRESPFQVLERKQVRNAILRAITCLPFGQSQVFILRDLQLLSISETAQVLGISETSVKTRLRRGRIQMRRALAHLRTIRAVEPGHLPTRTGEQSQNSPPSPAPGGRISESPVGSIQ